MNITQEQYLALVSLARAGCETAEKTRLLEKFLKDIEASNGLKRYLLLVQWQEMDSPLPRNTDFPAIWPPEMRATIERSDRPSTKGEVLQLVKERSKRATNILVTRDPAGLVGWTKVDDFFLT